MIDQIYPKNLKTWLDTKAAFGEPVVLDVREPQELQAASIQADGFKLITIPMSQLMARIDELDPSQPLACLCHHGMRSMQVASFLSKRGFDHLANIAGGIDAWSMQVDPAVPRY
jgi:rhodanese-related sulfurtransferase